MKLHLCGGLAAMILLTGCGQMGPLVLPPKEEAPQPKTHAPVTVQPAEAPAPGNGSEPASGVQTAPAPAEPKKDKP